MDVIRLISGVKIVWKNNRGKKIGKRKMILEGDDFFSMKQIINGKKGLRGKIILIIETLCVLQSKAT